MFILNQITIFYETLTLLFQICYNLKTDICSQFKALVMNVKGLPCPQGNMYNLKRHFLLLLSEIEELFASITESSMGMIFLQCIGQSSTKRII